MALGQNGIEKNVKRSHNKTPKRHTIVWQQLSFSNAQISPQRYTTESVLLFMRIDFRFLIIRQPSGKKAWGKNNNNIIVIGRNNNTLAIDIIRKIDIIETDFSLHRHNNRREIKKTCRVQ